MKFNSEEEAKNYAMSVTSGYLSAEEAYQRIEDYKTYSNNTHCTEGERKRWTKRSEELIAWVKSDDFIKGNHPLGIDELILSLLEWRASIYAFQHVDTDRNPFREYAFHAQWLSGGIYAIFCILGKLVSKDPKDNSLRKLWNEVKGYISQSGLCGDGEFELIEQKMHRSEGHFTNNNSKSILFRNKAIAHNERTPRVEWDEVDKDIELLCRVWSLITMWSSLGVLKPFSDGDVAFLGLDNIFNDSEIHLLKDKREQYIELTKKWFVSSLIDSSRISERSPIGKIAFSFRDK